MQLSDISELCPVGCDYEMFLINALSLSMSMSYTLLNKKFSEEDRLCLSVHLPTCDYS